MAGQPKARARREAAAAARAAGVKARPTDPASRAGAVARAAVVGDKAAAAECGVSPATIRSWRRRLAAAGGGGVPVVAGGAILPGPVGVGLSDEDDGLEQLQVSVREARASVAEATARARQLAALGNDAGARDAQARGKLAAATVRDLEAALATAGASEARLSDGHARAIVAVITESLAACGLERGPAVRALLRELLTSAARGEVRELSGMEARGMEAARAEVWGELRARLRVEVEASVRGEVEGELRAAADAVRVQEARLAPVEPVSKPVEGEDAEGEGEPVAVEAPPVEPARPARDRGGALPMTIPKGSVARGRPSLADRLRRGGE